MKKILIGLSIIFAILIGYFTFDLMSFNKAQKNTHIEFGEKASKKIATQMDSVLQLVMEESRALAQNLSQLKFSEDSTLKQQLKHASQTDENILGFTAAFEPNAFWPEKRLYAPFYDKNKKSFVYCEDVYDYTDEALSTSQWYVQVRNNGEQWIEPYFAGAAQTMVADFGTPIHENGKTVGTVTGTFSLFGLRSVLNALSLGKTGYAFALSKEGKFLTHPNSDLPKSGKTINELAQEEETWNTIADYMAPGATGFTSFKNQVTGQESWLFFAPVKAAGWSIGVVMIKDELMPEPEVINRKKIHIALSSVALLICLIALFSGALSGKERGFWVISFSSSLLFIFIIGLIWNLELASNRSFHSENSILIADYAGLNSFLNANNSKAKALNKAKPIYIPTGVFIEEMEFIDAYNVNVGGHIWQKFGEDVPKDIDQTLSLPQVSPDAEAFIIKKTYQEKLNDYELVGWEFRATLRLDFDYRSYPFDRREISIKIRQNEFLENVILTPDFDAYKTLTPSSLPGTEDDLVIPGWDTQAAYFDYKVKSYNANFGIEDYHGQENVPEFHYNILLKRHILSPFISTMIPLLVVALMLFGVVVSTTKSKTKNTFSGFSTFGVVQACAAFFFVIILGHIDMRSGMDIEEISYIEYFYFIMYFLLLFVSFNVVMFSSELKTKLLDFEDNLIMKIGYWPFLLVICMVATLITFY